MVGTAVCDTCGAFFRPSTAAPSEPTTPSPTKAVPVDLPERFKVSRMGDRSLVVQWSSYRRWQVLQLVLAGVLLLLVGARVLVDPSPEPWTSRGSWQPVWLGLLAVLMAFGAVVQMVSYTRHICTRAALQVRRGPFPWYRSRVIGVKALQQLYVERHIISRTEGKVVWNLSADTAKRRGQVLLEGLDTLEQALWLERELEDLLGIEDRPVAGEFRGDLRVWDQ